MKKLMKNVTFTLLLSIMLFKLSAQKPEPVYSIVKQIKSFDWYKEQAGLWKKEIDKNPTNADAWLNYYTANRMAKLCGEPEKWMNGKENVLQDLNVIIEKAKESIPNTFEYNYMKWYNGGNKDSLFQYLQKAYEMAPDRIETYDDLVTYYEIKKMADKRKEFNQKWMKSNDVSSGIMAFGYNMLMSTEKNAILITNGDNDTYPLWMLQDAKSVRTDVHILNINLLMIDDYRELCFKELGIPNINTSQKEYKSAVAKQIEIIDQIIKNKGSYEVYFAVSVQPALYASVEKDLYNEGLAFRYSASSYDNMAILKKNVENRFLLDDLTVNLRYDISESVVNQTNTNYIVAFISLYQHYKLSQDLTKAEKMKVLIKSIAEKSDMEEQVNKYFTE